MLVLWPMPMYGSGYIFSKPFFTGWVVVGILWIFCSFFAVGLFPIWEGRATLIHTIKSMFGGKKPTRHTVTHAEHTVTEKTTPGDVTPEKKLEVKE
jgi:urea-proton symporter